MNVRLQKLINENMIYRTYLSFTAKEINPHSIVGANELIGYDKSQSNPSDIFPWACCCTPSILP
ncbi:MAG: hypothetical protein E3K29_08005 [Candidatus Brocadia sp.]|nr:hypothetical protein [Candidatus Brocadia sp.]